MSCCEWEDFEIDLIDAFERSKISIDLINWPSAKHYWKRHHCTGAEAAIMLIREMRKEADEVFSIIPMQGEPKPQAGSE